MVESTGLLNRRRGQTLPQVRILSSPLRFLAVSVCLRQNVATLSFWAVSARPRRDLATAWFLAVSTWLPPRSRHASFLLCGASTSPFDFFEERSEKPRPIVLIQRSTTVFLSPRHARNQPLPISVALLLIELFCDLARDPFSRCQRKRIHRKSIFTH